MIKRTNKRTNKNSTEIIATKANTTVALTSEERLNELRNMSLRDIDKYGVQIQERLDTTSSDLLRSKSMQELGASKKSLDELDDIAKYNKKMLPVLRTPLRKLKSFQSNFVKIGDQLDSIKEAIIKKHNEVDEYIMTMVEQTENLGKAIVDIKECEDTMSIYAQELQQEESQDSEIRLREVSSRLQLLTGTRVNAEHAQIEAYLVIKMQQEAKYQLAQVIQNVIPILSMQAVNALGIQSNKETLKIISKTRDITGEIIERNANEVRNIATELQNNRTLSVVDTDKLLNAQKILNETMKVITEASKLETDSNMKIINDLREQSKSNQEMITNLMQKS